MKQRLALLIFFSLFATASAGAQQREYILLVGGPSLHVWEQYKGPIAHDHWWANFVHSARVRTEQLRVQLGPDAMITWLVYKPGYIDRGRQEKQNLIANINSVRDKFHLNLIYFAPRRRRDRLSEQWAAARSDQNFRAQFFGHSNKACFLFDYSNVSTALQSVAARNRIEEDRPTRFRARRLCKKLGLPHRREHEPALARCDRHPDVGGDRQDRLLDRRVACAFLVWWQVGLLRAPPLGRSGNDGNARIPGPPRTAKRALSRLLDFLGGSHRPGYAWSVAALDFERLVEDYYMPLYRFALSLSRQESDAADLTQQTFFLWASKGHQLRDASKVKTWLFTSLYREFLGANGSRTVSLKRGIATKRSARRACPASIVNQLDGDIVQRALFALEEIYRAPLTLFYLQQHSYREIAETLEVPVGTVMSRISRGKEQLRKALADSAGLTNNEEKKSGHE